MMPDNCGDVILESLRLQATFLTTQMPPRSQLSHYRWRVIASVFVCLKSTTAVNVFVISIKKGGRHSLPSITLD